MSRSRDDLRTKRRRRKRQEAWDEAHPAVWVFIETFDDRGGRESVTRDYRQVRLRSRGMDPRLVIEGDTVEAPSDTYPAGPPRGDLGAVLDRILSS